MRYRFSPVFTTCIFSLPRLGILAGGLARRLDPVAGILFTLSLLLGLLSVAVAGRRVVEFASTVESNRKESPIVWALKSLTKAFILVCTVLLSSVISRVSRKLTLL